MVPVYVTCSNDGKLRQWAFVIVLRTRQYAIHKQERDCALKAGLRLRKQANESSTSANAEPTQSSSFIRSPLPWNGPLIKSRHRGVHFDAHAAAL